MYFDLGIGVLHFFDDLAGYDFHPDLFLALADGAFLRALACFDLAAGKFPKMAQVGFFFPLGNEKPAGPFNQAGHHTNSGWGLVSQG